MPPKSIKRLSCYICKRSGDDAWVGKACGHCFHTRCFRVVACSKKRVQCPKCQKHGQWSALKHVVVLKNGNTPNMYEAKEQIQEMDNMIEDQGCRAVTLGDTVVRLTARLQDRQSDVSKAAILRSEMRAKLTVLREAVANNATKAEAVRQELVGKMAVLKKELAKKDAQLAVAQAVVLAEASAHCQVSLKRTRCPMPRKQDEGGAKTAAVLGTRTNALGLLMKNKARTKV